MGEFGRNESSPLPWVAFVDSYSRHGISDAFLALIGVVIVDLWLFWTPSQIYKTSILELNHDKFYSYINKDSIKREREEIEEMVDVFDIVHQNQIRESNKRKIIFVRVINAFVGLLLVTPNNPVYRLIEYFVKHGSKY
ncbi:MAG: hypothetical protein SCARUB_04840 [Candidatus Scalindua rubra]|uniref:Uncharacterized protein n=1 Tax=Candidatus Scalindua rubra TaxID=1872076 RepID=A0A1E3X502_9BACT|nr:MAG: hypothetical protein SCARUB_04840 [Candidatus Scalindua rubra]